MLLPRNTLCLRRATWMLCCTIFSAVAVATGSNDVPSEAVGRQAFETARAWVSDVAVPHADSPDAAFELDGAAGVCVQLWRSGRVVGSGTDWTGDELMLRRAVARALGGLLGEPAVQNLPEDVRDMAGRMVAIELEIAGEPQPIVAPTFEHAGRRLDPGIDGIAMRRDQDWALRFPAQFRATNTADTAHRQFLALAADIGLPPVALRELKSTHNAAAYRFGVISLAQREPEAPPFVATRGEQVVDLEDVTGESVCTWASEAAANLSDRFAFADVRDKGDENLPEPVGLAGTYHPVANTMDPLFAPPIEQALGAFALMRASRSNLLPNDVRSGCLHAAIRVLHDLSQVTAVEADPFEGATTCALLVATNRMTTEAGGPEFPEMQQRAAERLMQAYVPTQSFDSSLTPHERAIVAWGLVQLSRVDPLTLPAETAQAAVEDAWAGVAEHERVALLPWIGWATTDLVGREEAPAHAEGLRELTRGLCASRVTSAHRTFADDLAGGLPLMSAGRSHPTSQTLRPASWLAGAVCDERIIPADERDARLAELRDVMRFGRQLMVRDENAWRYRNRGRALGGVRAATWDHSQPVPAQALGLITLLEAAESLQNAEKGQPEGRETRKSP